MTIARNVEGDIDALRRCDLRVDFILQPVLGNFPLNDLDVPAVPRAKVASATRDSETAFGSAGVEGAIRTADRPAFAEGNLVGFFLRCRLRLRFGRGWRLLRLDLGILDRKSVV